MQQNHGFAPPEDSSEEDLSVGSPAHPFPHSGKLNVARNLSRSCESKKGRIRFQLGEVRRQYGKQGLQGGYVTRSNGPEKKDQRPIR